jgi:hypothetical protein
VQLRRPARRIASSRGLINVDVNVILVSGDRGAIAFEEEESPMTIEVNVREGTLSSSEGEGEMGQFAATPADAGDHDIWLWLKNPRINGQPVTRAFYVPVGEVNVEDRPWWQRLRDLLFSVEGVVSSLAGIVLIVYGLLRWSRRDRGGDTGAQHSG